MNFPSRSVISMSRILLGKNQNMPAWVARMPLVILVGLPLSLFSLSLAAPAPQNDSRLRLTDDSDWWSEGKSFDSEVHAEPQERELPNSNFRILEISLGDEMFNRAAMKMGKTTLVERGEAGEWRSQACYVSAEGPEKTYLVFEQGEVDFAFYLFAEGPDWKGRERCLRSTMVSRGLVTGSGLKLGLTPAEVITVLGKPSVRR
jgi:hypothetical protein